VASGNPRWLGVSDSQYAHEREGLAHIKTHLPVALGGYAATGLTNAQGEKAKEDLLSSLRVVMEPGYDPPSPMKDLAANRSIDSLAPDNPMAAELQQIREAVEELRRGASRPRRLVSDVEEMTILRKVLERNNGAPDESDFSMLLGALVTLLWVPDQRV